MASGKKKDDNFTEDSSVYVHGDEYTNAANVNSNRHDINFDGMEALSDDDNIWAVKILSINLFFIKS